MTSLASLTVRTRVGALTRLTSLTTLTNKPYLDHGGAPYASRYQKHRPYSG